MRVTRPTRISPRAPDTSRAPPRMPRNARLTARVALAMPPLTGIYIVAELHGSVAERIHQIQLEHDPKLARLLSPHVTIAGSSGMGPIRPDVPVAELRSRLE